MAEASQGEAAEPVTGFEQHATETLLKIRALQERGIAEVHRHIEAGTWKVRPKPGAATPKEAGETIVMIYDAIGLELQRRGVLKK